MPPKLSEDTKARRAAMGARLREEREAAGLSMQQLADAMNVDKWLIQRYEEGRKAIPADEINRICFVFGNLYAEQSRDRLLDKIGASTQTTRAAA